MAQPQGLNVGSIIVTGVVGTILTMTIVEGVRAYYNRYNAIVTAERWDEVKGRTADVLREQQVKAIEQDTTIPIEQAMAKIASTGGKLPPQK